MIVPLKFVVNNDSYLFITVDLQTSKPFILTEKDSLVFDFDKIINFVLFKLKESLFEQNHFDTL